MPLTRAVATAITTAVQPTRPDDGHVSAEATGARTPTLSEKPPAEPTTGNLVRCFVAGSAA